MKKLTWLFLAMLMSGVAFVTQAQDTSSIKAQLDYTPGEPTMLIWWDANDEDYPLLNSPRAVPSGLSCGVCGSRSCRRIQQGNKP